jgi:general secretion pathway protein D
VATGDFAGTGLLDATVANLASNTVSVILNPVNSQLSSTSPSTAYPASEYVDLGLKVHATARVHPPDEVSLNMQFEITALAGQNVNSIPIISNRSIEQMVRLRANETSILSGLIETSEIRSITGWPDLTFLGPLTGDHSKQQSETELVIAITPRQLRVTPREDRTFYAGRGVGTAAPPEPAGPGQLPPQPPGAAPVGVPPVPGVPPPGGVPGAPQPGPGALPGAPGNPPQNPAPNEQGVPPPGVQQRNPDR